MKFELIEILCRPKTGQKLNLKTNSSCTTEIATGNFVSEYGLYCYPITNGIPLFISKSNCADNFGIQWNYFCKTQLDCHSGQLISAERFQLVTNCARLRARGIKPH